MHAYSVSYFLFLSELHSVKKMTENQGMKRFLLFCKVFFLFATNDFNQ